MVLVHCSPLTALPLFKMFDRKILTEQKHEDVNLHMVGMQAGASFADVGHPKQAD